MNEVQQLHRDAMSLAEEAALEQSLGNVSCAKALYLAAFEKERRAAEYLDTRFDLEPTRSVLFRSAASLALDCGDHRSAEKLIARALSGDPPPEIAEELRNILETVYFQRHLEVRGVILEPHEFQVSIAGSAIGFGVAESDTFIGRIQDVRKLIYRTAERKANRPFRERGRPGGDIEKQFSTWLSVPRASSFAVTFRVGYSVQMHLPGLDLDPAESVISELLDGLDVVGGGDPNAIEKLIPDAAYRRNFIALARRLAPDGEEVTTVGFTAMMGGSERRVSLTRTPNEMVLPSSTERDRESDVSVTVEGMLKFANSMNAGRNEIKLVETTGKKHNIIVPEGYMDDIVRPLWDCNVRVDGVRKGSSILLRNVTASSEPTVLP